MVLWFLGAVVLSTICVGGVLLYNQFNQRRIVSPTQVPLPVFVDIPSPTATATASPVPTVPTPIPATATMLVAPASIGTSCRYGPPWINNVATEVPDGGNSEQQGYKCVNGYWFLGVADWVDGKGDWGTDGVEEAAYIAYNADGTIADRKFINLSGTVIPGPTK